MECECKAHDEEEKDQEEFGECSEDVCEHHDVKSKKGKLLDEKKQVEPSQKNRDRSNLPLPGLRI